MYFLGIDTSTTSSKALLIDEHGEVVAVASNPHTLQTCWERAVTIVVIIGLRTCS